MHNGNTTLKPNILFLGIVYMFLCLRLISVHADFPSHQEKNTFLGGQRRRVKLYLHSPFMPFVMKLLCAEGSKMASKRLFF